MQLLMFAESCLPDILLSFTVELDASDPDSRQQCYADLLQPNPNEINGFRLGERRFHYKGGSSKCEL